MATRSLTPKQQKAVDQLLLDPSLKRCAEATGYSYDYVRQLVTKPHIVDALETARAERSKRTQIDADWVLEQLVKVYGRCMQVEETLDREGNPTGKFRFEHTGATRSLELIGKHVGAFKPGGDVVPAPSPENFKWKLTVVHVSKETYDKAKAAEKPVIEYDP